MRMLFIKSFSEPCDSIIIKSKRKNSVLLIIKDTMVLAPVDIFYSINNLQLLNNTFASWDYLFLFLSTPRLEISPLLFPRNCIFIIVFIFQNVKSKWIGLQMGFFRSLFIYSKLRKLSPYKKLVIEIIKKCRIIGICFYSCHVGFLIFNLIKLNLFIWGMNNLLRMVLSQNHLAQSKLSVKSLAK